MTGQNNLSNSFSGYIKSLLRHGKDEHYLQGFDIHFTTGDINITDKKNHKNDVKFKWDRERTKNNNITIGKNLQGDYQFLLFITYIKQGNYEKLSGPLDNYLVLCLSPYQGVEFYYFLKHVKADISDKILTKDFFGKCRTENIEGQRTQLLYNFQLLNSNLHSYYFHFFMFDNLLEIFNHGSLVAQYEVDLEKPINTEETAIIPIPFVVGMVKNYKTRFYGMCTYDKTGLFIKHEYIEISYSELDKECINCVIGDLTKIINEKEFRAHDEDNKKQIIARNNQKIREIKGNIEKLLLDNDAQRLANNFLEEYGKQIFLNDQELLALESWLFWECEPYSVFLSDHAKSVSEFERTHSSHFIELSYFSKVLQEMIDANNTESLYVGYLYLSIIAKKKYSEEWFKKNKENIEINIYSDLSSIMFSYLESNTMINEQDKNRFIYYLMENKYFSNTNDYFLDCYQTYNYQYSLIQKRIEYKNFKNLLLKDTDKKILTIDEIDLMTGLEFEVFIGELFNKMGYKVEITKATGDQGIDVIALKNASKLGIQTKCFSSTVGNSAIQEAVTGIAFYNLNKAIVVTNQYFTDSAKALAKANNVVLWDRNLLKEKIIEYNSR
ncbi:MAG: hypothetical protein C0391_02595 [Anaerolinea sp.]|nr:hypothetical protein [Anaerolinea sp.]